MPVWRSKSDACHSMAAVSPKLSSTAGRSSVTAQRQGSVSWPAVLGFRRPEERYELGAAGEEVRSTPSAQAAKA